ncbi:MAG: hypothetical protein LBJ63_00965 [Prevotellaceae bacterium]|jgi:hypothetical protein|nr:hypothetical protein [Prevotellaceae bacterium]
MKKFQKQMNVTAASSIKFTVSIVKAIIWSSRVIRAMELKNDNATVAKKYFRLEYRYKAW